LEVFPRVIDLVSFEGDEVAGGPPGAVYIESDHELSMAVPISRSRALIAHADGVEDDVLVAMISSTPILDGDAFVANPEPKADVSDETLAETLGLSTGDAHIQREDGIDEIVLVSPRVENPHSISLVGAPSAVNPLLDVAAELDAPSFVGRAIEPTIAASNGTTTSIIWQQNGWFWHLRADLPVPDTIALALTAQSVLGTGS
jgi:hypothetical protein